MHAYTLELLKQKVPTREEGIKKTKYKRKSKYTYIYIVTIVCQSIYMLHVTCYARYILLASRLPLPLLYTHTRTQFSEWWTYLTYDWYMVIVPKTISLHFTYFVEVCVRGGDAIFETYTVTNLLSTNCFWRLYTTFLAFSIFIFTFLLRLLLVPLSPLRNIFIYLYINVYVFVFVVVERPQKMKIKLSNRCALVCIVCVSITKS